MSRNANKKNKRAHKLDDKPQERSIIEEIIKTQEFIKNEDFLEEIAMQTLKELSIAKVKQKIKYTNMLNWHYNALQFIKKNNFSPKSVENIKSWIENNKAKLDSNQISEGKCIDSENEINGFSYFIPNFIYFISTSFRPIFLSNSICIDFNKIISNLKTAIDEFLKSQADNTNSNSTSTNSCITNTNPSSLNDDTKNIKNVLDAIEIDPKKADIILEFMNSTNPTNENSTTFDMILNIVNIILNTIKDIKAQMYHSWELNINLLPLTVYNYLMSDNKKEVFYSKMRSSFKLIFENPNIFQISYFYESQLPEPFTSSFVDNFFDNDDFDQYFKLLSADNNENNEFDLEQYFSDQFEDDIESSYNEQSQVDLKPFEKNFKDLLRLADLLPDFPKAFYNQVDNLELFINQFLVQRGNLNDFDKRKECFDKMCNSIPDNYPMKTYLSDIDFKKFRFAHSQKLELINRILEKRKENSNYFDNLIITLKFTLSVLEFNCVRAIIQCFNESNKETAFQKIINTAKSVITGKIDNEDKNDPLYIFKNPKELSNLYNDIIKQNNQHFTPKNEPVKQNESDIYYDWNTYLIFNLVKGITFDKFLAYRQEVKTFDHTYVNLFLANQNETMEKIDDDEEQNNDDDDDDGYIVTLASSEENYNNNDDDDDANTENQDQSENYVINDEDEKKYNSLVLDLITAFQTFSNPIQKVIDIYEALRNITKFFKNDGKKLFNHKIGESRVNIVENLDLNINFNIFDFVCFPNFVSSLIFIFDYYFLPFGRNLKIKTLFIQIYNYAVKKYYTEDRLHFDIVSSEGKLYQHLLSCRQVIKMIFIGKCQKGTIKNNILTNLLKNSLPDKVEESDIYPMSEFVETAKELTCTFFKNSTFYFCTIISVETFNDIKDSAQINKKNKKQFTGFVFFPESPANIPEAKNLTDFVNDIKLVHIVCNGKLHYNFMSKFKEVAIIHTSFHFDIKNIF